MLVKTTNVMKRIFDFIIDVLKSVFYIGRNRAWYTGSGQNLPPPLSKVEEVEVMQRLSSGDFSVRSILIERNLRLVVYIAKKFENTGIPLEDLISIGSIGLIKAVNTFKPDKNIKLATYSSRCIENEILMFLRRKSRSKAEVSLDEPLNIDGDGNELLLSDILGTEGDLVSKKVEKQVDQELLVNAISTLNEREQNIIRLRYGIGKIDEKTQKEVAIMLGISQSYISRLEKRIIKRLKNEIARLI